jgi:hypothetical protein
MQICPRCTLISPDGALRCDCGFDFSNVTPELLEAEFARSQQEALRRALGGLALGVGAIAVSVALYAAAEPGGTYVVFYGAALAGLITAGRGVTRILDLRKAKKESSTSR